MSKEELIEYLQILKKKSDIDITDIHKIGEIIRNYNYFKQFYVDFRKKAIGIKEIINGFNYIIERVLKRGVISEIFQLLRLELFEFVDISKFPKMEEFEWLVLLNNALETLSINNFKSFKALVEKKYHLIKIVRENWDKFPKCIKKAILIAPASELKVINSSEDLKFGIFKDLFDILQWPCIILTQYKKEISVAEDRLGLKLPESVKEFYSLFASIQLLEAFSMERFAGLHHLRIDRDIVELIHTTDQYNFCFGFKITEDEDPNIYYWNEESAMDQDKVIWRDTGEKFSTFIFNFIVNNYFHMLYHYYLYDEIEFNEEFTKEKFIGCIKNDFKKIEIKYPEDLVFGSNVGRVFCGGIPDYYYNSSLELYIDISPDKTKKAFCFYKDEEKLNKFLNNLKDCLDLSSGTFQEAIKPHYSTKEMIIVDLANFLMTEDRKGEKLLMGLGSQLSENDLRYKYVLDGKLKNKWNHLRSFDWMIRDKIITLTPEGEVEQYILKLAKGKKMRFLSNNLFEDYYDLFGKEWIDKNRIGFKIIDDKIILSQK